MTKIEVLQSPARGFMQPHPLCLVQSFVHTTLEENVTESMSRHQLAVDHFTDVEHRRSTKGSHDCSRCVGALPRDAVPGSQRGSVRCNHEYLVVDAGSVIHSHADRLTRLACPSNGSRSRRGARPCCLLRLSWTRVCQPKDTPVRYKQPARYCHAPSGGSADVRAPRAPPDDVVLRGPGPVYRPPSIGKGSASP